MSWSEFYLVCFLVGFILTAVSFLFGGAHTHLPHHGGGAHFHLGHGHGARGGNFSFFNFGTGAAFLAWFGGAGFLLAHYASVWAWFALGVAILSGLGGAAVVFWFVAKVLMASERDLDPADYDPIGALGRLSSVLRAGGTGEMIYSQQGSRRSIPARSEDGAPIPKGTEVVITRYEKGIAYVRRWDELAGNQE
jgi:membrane protein implicated in regulation of membrane protease activity